MGTSNTSYDDWYSRHRYYTIRNVYSSSGSTTYYTTIVNPVKREDHRELEVGDTTALDEFLGGFKCEEK